MAKIEKGGYVKRSSGENKGPLIMGVTVRIESFERDKDGRPYVNGVILNEGKMQGEPCILYAENDVKIADRASADFRGGARKHKDDAKMKECVEGGVLYAEFSEVSKNKDGGYTLKAKYLNTVSEKPSETAEPVYMRVVDYGEQKVAFTYSKDAVENEVRGDAETVANLMADALEAATPEDANSMVFMVRNIKDGAADQVVSLSTWNRDAKRTYTPEEFIEKYIDATKDFDGEHSAIIGKRYSVSSLMDEGRAHALTVAFRDLTRGTPVISDVAPFVNGGFVNGVVRVNPTTGKGYPSSPVRLDTLGSSKLPKLEATKAEDIKDAAPAETPPPPPEAPAETDPLAPGTRGGPRAR